MVVVVLRGRVVVAVVGGLMAVVVDGVVVVEAGGRFVDSAGNREAAAAGLVVVVEGRIFSKGELVACTASTCESTPLVGSSWVRPMAVKPMAPAATRI